MKLTKIALIGLMSMSSLVAEFDPFGIKFGDTLDNYKVIKKYEFGAISGAVVKAPEPDGFFNSFSVHIVPRTGKIYVVNAERDTTSVEECKEAATVLKKEFEKGFGPEDKEFKDWDWSRPYEYRKTFKVDGKEYFLELTCLTVREVVSLMISTDLE